MNRGAEGPARPPRIALFTHDTYGLGHVRRSLRFVHALAAKVPGAPILLVTGSPVSHPFEGLPAHADWIKIPTVVKTGSPEHRPSHLPISLSETTRLRAGLIREAMLGFSPDVLLVDNFPLGSRRELLPVLRDLRRGRTRVLLGLRDILDMPEVVRADWERQGMVEVLNRYYDEILVYGMREVLDLAQAYAIPPAISRKMRYCGYVAPSPAGVRETSIEAWEGAPYLLATGGGGGDGFPLLWTFLEALDHLPPQPALILTGPLMSAADRDRLRTRAAARDRVSIRDYVSDLRPFLSGAEVVVSMCGYNTAVEIVAQRARAVVVPRTWRYGEHGNGTAAGTEGEQLLRARALAACGYVDVVEPDELTAERLAAAIGRARERGTSDARPLDLGGVDAVVEAVLGHCREEAPDAR
jgi:predicted glycosyltransferase